MSLYELFNFFLLENNVVKCCKIRILYIIKIGLYFDRGVGGKFRIVV